MPPPNPSTSPEIPPDHASQRRRSHRSKRRSHRGDVVLGRVYLIGFWILARSHDVWISLTTPEDYLRDVLVKIVPLGILDTALFGALLGRQAWARYLLITYHMYRVASYLIVIPITLQVTHQVDGALIFRMASAPVMDSLIIWALICSPDIRRLVTRTYE